jgi:hypothetical protein
MVQQRLPAWEEIGAGSQVMSWLREGVRIPWRQEVRSPWSHLSPYQLRFGANWGVIRVYLSLFKQSGSKTHTQVNTLLHVPLVSSRFAPHHDGISSGMRQNR